MGQHDSTEALGPDGFSPRMEETYSNLLRLVGGEAAQEYRVRTEALVDAVNSALMRRPDLAHLVGQTSVGVMLTNHANHAHFMLSQFLIPSGRTFCQTVRWVYRTYSHLGFSTDYFPVQLDAWMGAVSLLLSGDTASRVNAVYATMAAHHAEFMRAAAVPEPPVRTDPNFRPVFDAFTAALLAADTQAALAVTRECVVAPSAIGPFWEWAVRPALYEVGRMWAMGKLTVGQEHAATAVAQRVMSAVYPMIIGAEKTRGRALVGSIEGDTHDIGTRMVSDLLELNGWQVQYFGANTPAAGLLAAAVQHNADVVCVGATLVANLWQVRDLAVALRALRGDAPAPRLIVGGLAFGHDPQLWRLVGADAHAASAADLVGLLDTARPAGGP